LNRVVLREIPHDHIGIEPDHRRRDNAPRAAPATAAWLISSIETARRWRLTMPRRMLAGRFGNRTDFNPRCSRIVFGIVTWPLVVIADSIQKHSIALKCNTYLPRLSEPIASSPELTHMTAGSILNRVIWMSTSMENTVSTVSNVSRVRGKRPHQPCRRPGQPQTMLTLLTQNPLFLNHKLSPAT
jgi:hypothetical protein